MTSKDIFPPRVEGVVHRHRVLGSPTPTFSLIDTTRELTDFGLFKRYALPALYWLGMLRGRA